MTSSELWTVRLGLVPYSEALALQRTIAHKRISGEIEQDVLLLLEHPPVVTLGRATKAASLVASTELLAARGVELHEVERGGDVTFHGPGQLVGYPIIDLKRHRKDLHWYLRQVEQALIDAIAEFGLAGGRVEKYTGVWVGETGNRELGTGNREPGTALPVLRPRKIASIGVHARDWVTWHGFALNVNTDLRYFDLIVPCGISDVTMTSVARELAAGSVDMHAITRAVMRAMATTFGLRAVTIAPTELAAIATIDQR